MPYLVVNDAGMDKKRLYPTMRLFELDPFEFQHEIGTCILRLALGSSDYHNAFFSHLAEECGKFLHLLPDINDPQIALELMRVCFSVTCVMHAMRGSHADYIVVATTQLDDKVRDTIQRISHITIDDNLWEELTLPIKGKNTKTEEATLGVGLSSCRNVASAAHTAAALMDASELRSRLMENKNIDDDIRIMVSKAVKAACNKWADDANTKAESIEEARKQCDLKHKPDPTKMPAKTRARLSQVIISNRIAVEPEGLRSIPKCGDW